VPMISHGDGATEDAITALRRAVEKAVTWLGLMALLPQVAAVEASQADLVRRERRGGQADCPPPDAGHGLMPVNPCNSLDVACDCSAGGYGGEAVEPSF